MAGDGLTLLISIAFGVFIVVLFMRLAGKRVRFSPSRFLPRRSTARATWSEIALTCCAIVLAGTQIAEAHASVGYDGTAGPVLILMLMVTLAIAYAMRLDVLIQAATLFVSGFAVYLESGQVGLGVLALSVAALVVLVKVFSR